MRNVENAWFELGLGFQVGILDGAEHLYGCSAPAVPLELNQKLFGELLAIERLRK
jgi:hypothetical protein